MYLFSLFLKTVILGTIVRAGVVLLGSVDHSHSSGTSSSSNQNGLNQRNRYIHIFGGFSPEEMAKRLSAVTKLAKEKPGAYLYAVLMSKYNVDSLPVNDTKSAVEIKLLLKLTQIVDVDEKSQIMTTNVWLRHEWQDYRLQWDPEKFGGIDHLYIPAGDIWLPDTILYNNADGDYQITIYTKVQVRYDGLVVWEPPAIYKSFCAIDVEFFPYDTQMCELKFGPWTFDVSKVDFFLMNSKGEVSSEDDMAVDMGGFYESVEWDIIKISGFKKIFKYPCCQERYVDITYHFNIRRKTLFYTINLIIPCVMISFLTVLVFYLPCQSGEKIALSISTLLSLTWFILLLSEIIPPTSLVLPLIGKYLLFTMVLVTLSIAVTVLVLYNHFRHPYAYAMPYWVRYVFLDVMPKLMFFKTIFDDQQLRSCASTNHSQSQEDSVRVADKSKGLQKFKKRLKYSRNSIIYNDILLENEMENGYEHLLYHSNSSYEETPCNKRKKDIRMTYGALLSTHEEGEYLIKEALPALDKYMLLPEVKEAVKCIHFISKRYRNENRNAKMRGDWEAVSRVLDRFFLIVFSIASTMGTMAILLTAPSLYDQTPPLVASDPGEIEVETMYL